MSDHAPSSYPTTALSQDTSTVLEAARDRPVVLTRYRKPRYALMSIEEYERLTGGAVRREETAQRSTTMAALPPDELAAFVAAIDDDLST